MGPKSIENTWKGFSMARYILMVVAVVAMMGSVVLADGWEVSGLTDLGTSMGEVRIGHEYGKDWTVGALATYFSENVDNPSKDWGVGAYAKLVVDPDASIPVANWLPKLGDWLDLPESLTAETYLIGKGQMLPYEGGIDFAGSVGAGAGVGPAVFEVVYDIVESGDADNPVLASGMTIWFGLRLEF